MSAPAQERTATGTARAAEVRAVHAAVADGLDELVEHLVGWCRLRSVGGLPEHAPDLQRSANWLAGVLRETGFPVVEVWEVEGGAPAVYAEWCAAPGAPTVLVYSHHDVRAAKDDSWGQVPPFEPAVRDGRVWGRGTSDAKGQVLEHVWAVRAHLAATGRDVPAVNLRLLVEGEEEQSSPHLAGLVERFRPRLDADLVVLSDTLLWRADAPAVCLGVRGVLSAELEVYGPERDAHSGAVSGPAPSAVLALARLVAALVGPDGRIALPGFYDDVLPPAESERAAIAALPYFDEDWLARSETRSIGGEEGFSVLERLWLRPALEVTSLVAGDVEGPPRAVTPAVAHAAMSIRTVPGQRVERVAEALRTFVADTLGPSVPHALQIALETAQEAYRTPDDLPAVTALRQAMAEGFGREVGQMRNGGGAPADLLAESLGAPVVFFGTGLVEDHWHDSDESVRVDLLHAGTATLALLWSRLAEG